MTASRCLCRFMVDQQKCAGMTARFCDCRDNTGGEFVSLKSKQKPATNEQFKKRKKVNSNSRDRISRLFLWLDETLVFLEHRHLQTDEALTSAEHEKDARTMISLIRVYEKLVEMTEHLDQKKPGASLDLKGYDAAETEQMRLEIAQRIERLQRQNEQCESDE